MPFSALGLHIANNFDLCFQFDVELFFDRPQDMRDQLQIIGGSSTIDVDDKSSVFGGNLCAADSQSL
ncbi:hypothetical protein D3C80_1732210 [compost metagenome]